MLKKQKLLNYRESLLYALTLSIVVGDQMFLGLQNFDFVQIKSKFAHISSLFPKFRFNFAQILPQFCSNLPKYNQLCPKSFC